MRRQSNSDPISLFAFQDIITAVTGIILLLVILLALSLVQLPETVPEKSGSDNREAELASEIKELKSELKDIHLDSNLDESLKLLPAAEIKKRLKELELLAKNLAAEKATLNKDLDSQKAALLEAEMEIDTNPNFALSQQLRTDLRKTENEIAKLQQTNKRMYNFNKSKKSPWIIDMRKDEIRVSKSHQGPSEEVFDDRSEFSRINRLKSWITRNGNSSTYFVMIARNGTVPEFRQIKQHVESMGADIGIDLVSESTTVLE